MKKILALAALLMAVFAACGQPSPQRSSDTLTRTVIYRPGDYGSTNYRIPAIITAKDGSLVIATDKRKFNEGDLFTFQMNRCSICTTSTLCLFNAHA